MAHRAMISFIFRKTRIDIATFDPTHTVLDWLREEQNARGTKEGCNEGDCGACTVAILRLKNGRLTIQPANACILLLGQLDGAELLTIEDLAEGNTLHPVQAAMVRHHGSQCGFCTPGIVMSLFCAYHEAPRPVSREAITERLAGNLCRCTGYRPIIEAAHEALAEAPDDALSSQWSERTEALIALNDGRDVLCASEGGLFAAPRSLEAALSFLATHPDATLLGGATDVGLWVTKALARLPKILWLGHVAELGTIAERPEGLHLGATVSLEESVAPLVRLAPDFGPLMRRFASRQVRSSGTIGGNIANGSPIGDLAPAFIALGATLHLASAGRQRSLPLEDFFLDYRRQDRDPGEIITGISLPRLGEGEHFRAIKLSKRPDEDISAVMGAFRFEVSEGRIRKAHIAFGGMAGTPKRAPATEAALTGLAVTDSAGIAEAAFALGMDFTPLSDMRASAEYRMRAARALLAKAVLEIAGAQVPVRIDFAGGMNQTGLNQRGMGHD